MESGEGRGLSDGVRWTRGVVGNALLIYLLEDPVPKPSDAALGGRITTSGLARGPTLSYRVAYWLAIFFR